MKHKLPTPQQCRNGKG